MSSVLKKSIAIFFVAMLLIVAVLGLLPSIAFAASSQYVKFEYLQRIKDTPFAEKITTFINVPVYENNEIKLGDVKKALKCTSFGVMQSTCDKFEYNAETKTYTTVYLKSVYLNAKTADGNSKNFYLDCNVSFEEYFRPFVDDNIMEEGCYQVFLNDIRAEYPAVQDISANNLYGYFGFIPIPKERDLNQLWSDMFSGTKYSGVLNSFSYEKSLSNDAYKKLLTDYEHSWLETAWKGFVDWVVSGSPNARFYIIYVDSQTKEAFIAENGAHDINDNSGAIWNGVENGVNYAYNAIKDFFSQPKNIWAIVGVVVGVFVLVGMVLVIVLAVKSIAKTVTKEAVKNGNRKR